jgi:hypothetical protein
MSLSHKLRFTHAYLSQRALFLPVRPSLCSGFTLQCDGDEDYVYMKLTSEVLSLDIYSIHELSRVNFTLECKWYKGMHLP